MFKPMLACEADLAKLKFPILASAKLDGVRAVVRGGVVYSRSNKPIPNVYVQDLLDTYEHLDGELIVGEPTSKACYRDTVSHVMSLDKCNYDLRFYVFDHIQHLTAPYVDRLQQVEAVPHIHLHEQRVVTCLSALLALEEKMLDEGYEGLILRAAEAPYKCGRSTMKEGYLLKLKRFTDAEFDAAATSVVYEQNGVTITAFPVIHALHGAVGYRVDFAGVSMVFSGDTHPCWPLVHAAQGTDLLIHECFPSAATLAALTGGSIENFQVVTSAHTVPKTAGMVFSLVQPRMGALWHTFLVPAVVVPILEEVSAVFDGPVVQTQDLTIFNITKEAVVARQVQAVPQAFPTVGEAKIKTTYGTRPKPPAWWAEAMIPDDYATTAAFHL